MAGGKRVKFQNTRIQFLVGWSGDSPSGVISAISKADPAVVTEASHGRTDGEVIRILGALGMTEVNGLPFVVDQQDANNYRLLDVDSTAYGTYTSGGRADLAQFSTLCELTGWNRQGGTSPEIPATSQCSEAQEFETGLPDFGTAQVDFNYAPDVSVQQAIQAAFLAGSPFAYRIYFYRGAAEIAAGTPYAFQLGFGTVQQTSEQGAVGGLWTGSFTLRNSGKPYMFSVSGGTATQVS